MIHYTLLPKEEMKLLRREYRTRLSIIALFFISTAVALGIISLLPSFLYTQDQEQEALLHQAVIEKNRKASGAEQIEKDLIKTQAIAEKIVTDGDTVVSSEVIEKILTHRSHSITISSFEITHEGAGTTTLTRIIVQGKSATRESLLDFKKGLESDSTFTSVELPLSDLAKSKNLSFAVRLSVPQNH